MGAAYSSKQRARTVPSWGFDIVGRTILTVYEKPTCTTCRKLRALLTERGVDFERLLARPVERVLELL